MSIVHVRHPVPIRYIPKGGHRPTFVLVEGTTPVEMAEHAATALRRFRRFDCLGMLEGHSRDLYEHGGRLWTPLLQQGRPMRQKDFVSWLGGAGLDVPFNDTSLDETFTLTPLLGNQDDWDTRGAPFDRARPREILHDGADRAAADVAAFLRSDVLFAGGVAYARFVGPLACLADPYLDASFMVEAHPRLNIGDAGFFVRCDRVGEIWDFYRRQGFPEAENIDAEPRLVPGHDFPSALVADDDLLLFANHVPQMTVAKVLRRMRRRDPGGGEGEGLLHHIDGLQPYLDLGQMGAVRMEEVEDVARRLHAFAGDALRLYPSLDAVEEGGLPALRGYVETIVLPRLGKDAAPDPDDLEALSGLAPGGPR